MFLQEVFDLLRNGELSQLSIGGYEAGFISRANQEKVIPHINLGLSAIYQRFPLKEIRVSFNLVPNSYRYTLKVDDINKIERVFTDSDYELTLNNEIDPYTIRTPSLKTLVVPSDIVNTVTTLPDELVTSAIEVIYRASHPKLIAEDPDLDPDELQLELPYTHLQALILFVAARMHTPAGSGQFEGIIGNMYYQRYEAAMQELEGLNPQVELTAKNARLHQKGWA